MKRTKDQEITFLRQELKNWKVSYRALRSAVLTLPADSGRAVWDRVPEFTEIERSTVEEA